MELESSDHRPQTERDIALRQLTAYDNFMCAISASNGSTHSPVVVIPSSETVEQEKWVGVDSVTAITKTVRQPDQERQALIGYADCGGLCYWYADELPSCLVFLLVMAVVLSILATPLTLLCLVPIMYKVNQARKKVNQKDLPAARGLCRTVCQWPCLCTIVWISLAVPMVIVAYALIIVFSVIDL